MAPLCPPPPVSYASEHRDVLKPMICRDQWLQRIQRHYEGIETERLKMKSKQNKTKQQRHNK